MIVRNKKTPTNQGQGLSSSRNTHTNLILIIEQFHYLTTKILRQISHL
jgi:hypothetical protein